MSAYMLQTGFSKEENLTGDLKSHLTRNFICSKVFFKDLTSSQMLLKDFAEIFQNSY